MVRDFGICPFTWSHLVRFYLKRLFTKNSHSRGRGEQVYSAVTLWSLTETEGCPVLQSSEFLGEPCWHLGSIWGQGGSFPLSSMGPSQEVNGDSIPSGACTTWTVPFLLVLVTQGFPQGLRKQSSLLVSCPQSWVSLPLLNLLLSSSWSLFSAGTHMGWQRWLQTFSGFLVPNFYEAREEESPLLFPKVYTSNPRESFGWPAWLMYPFLSNSLWPKGWSAAVGKVSITNAPLWRGIGVLGQPYLNHRMDSYRKESVYSRRGMKEVWGGKSSTHEYIMYMLNME